MKTNDPPMNIQDELNKVIKDVLQKNRKLLELSVQDESEQRFIHLEGLIESMYADVNNRIEKIIIEGKRTGGPEPCGILKYKWCANE